MKLTDIDLTKGNPIRSLVLFSIPMLLSGVFQQLYTTVDSMVMGRYVSVEAMAAVGACASMVNFFLNFALGLSNATGIVIAQYYGARNNEGIRNTAINAVLITLIGSLVMACLGGGFCRMLLGLLQTPKEIRPMSNLYATIVLSGLICMMTYNMTASILRGLGNTRAPLFFLMIASVLHILAALLLILVFHMGVAGVALATLFSQGVSAILTLLYIKKKYPVLHFSIKEIKPDKKLIQRILTLGLPMGLQSACFAIGMMVMQSTINTYGTNVVAGYTAAVRVEEISWIAFTTLCQAISSFSGQNAGAKDIERIHTGLRQSRVLIIFLTLGATLLIYLLHAPLLQIFIGKTKPTVFAVGKEFLLINSAFYLPMGLLMLYNFILKGMGFIKVPMISAAIELVCKVGFCLLLSHFFGYTGIWFAEPIGWVLAMIPPVIQYHRHKWEAAVQALQV